MTQTQSDFESVSQTLIIGDKPHHPLNDKFPQRVFKRVEEDGIDVPETSKKVSEVEYRFKSSWFQRWPSLHYLEDTDSVLCYYCAKANALKLTCSQREDLAFISTGYQNWKAATDSRKGFAKHQHSAYHKMAIEAIVLSNRCNNIGELLSESHKPEKDMNKQMLLHILSTVRFLARQGLAYRGHIDDNSGNFETEV